MGTLPVNSTITSTSRISKHIINDQDHIDLLHHQKAYEVVSLPFWKNMPDFYDQGYLQHAGELSLSHQINYFFWLIHHKKPKGKLLIWLNGGPGCTSTDGFILERGVFDIKRINGRLELNARNDGWHSFTNVLALDQPVGTGYSNGPEQSYAETLEQVATTFDEFLTVFFDLFPDYAKDDIYLGGESFAGIWIPAFANYTLGRPEAMKIKLKGLFIDSGWIDPKNQYPSTLPMVEKYSLLPKEKMNGFKGYVDKCLNDLKNTTITSAIVPNCEKMMRQVNEFSRKPDDDSGNETCINQYDFRLRDVYDKCGMGWPPSISEFYEFMKREDVAKALNTHLHNGEWEECNSEVHFKLDMDKVAPTIDLLPGLLKQLPILLFTGEYDFMVNSIGMDYLVGNLTKLQSNQHRLKVNDPDEGKWMDWGVDPQIKSGQVVKWGNLIQATVYNASHMASYDQPIPIGSLMRWFISGRPSSGIVPEPNSAPGFFYTSKFGNNSVVNPPLNKIDSHSTKPSNPTLEDATLTDSPSSSLMWAGFLVAFAVLGCLMIGLIRSRRRNPFRPDHQELLAGEETEMDTTHFNDSSPIVQERNSGDDYAFEFNDSDEEGLNANP